MNEQNAKGDAKDFSRTRSNKPVGLGPVSEKPASEHRLSGESKDEIWPTPNAWVTQVSKSRISHLKERSATHSEEQVRAILSNARTFLIPNEVSD